MRIIIILTGFILMLPPFVSGQAPLKWQRSYGTEVYNYGIKTIALPDTGYIILSNESGDIGNTSIRLIRTDKNGIIRWQKVHGGGTLRWASDFARTADGSYIICGNIYADVAMGYDVLLMKTDTAGNILWQSSAGGPDWDIGNAVVITPDSGYLVVGETYSYGNDNGNVYVVKFDAAGDTLWTRVFGGDSADYAASADVMADSTLIIGANTGSAGAGDNDAWVIRLSPNGDSIWSGTYGDTLEDRLNSIKALSDTGFVFVGYTRNYNALNTEFWLVRVDSAMNFIWKLPEPWTIGPDEDVAHSVSLNDSGQFVVGGYSTTSGGNGGKEMFVMAMGDWYDYKFSNTFGSIEDEECRHAIQTLDGGYLLTGESGGQGPSMKNVYLVKTGHDCQSVINCIYTTGMAEPDHMTVSSLKVYPNPTTGKVSIFWAGRGDEKPERIDVYDVTGKTVFEQTADHDASNDLLTIDLSGLPPGLYLVAVNGGSARFSQKLIIR